MRADASWLSNLFILSNFDGLAVFPASEASAGTKSDLFRTFQGSAEKCEIPISISIFFRAGAIR